jgi:DNA primase
MFDIENFISKHVEIQSKTEKEIFLKSCPFCGSPGKHTTTCSVARNKPLFHCFRCGKSGSWISLVAKLSRISYAEAKAIVSDGLDLAPTPKPEKEKEFVLHMPPRCHWTTKSENYLLDRGLTQQIIKKYALYYCRTGWYKERIIIPVVRHGIVVTFTARAIDKKTEPRYNAPKGSPKNKYWFNLDRYRPGLTPIIVEGAFDVMKLASYGIFAICPLGKTISMDQKNLLTKLKITAIGLLQDRDAAPYLSRVWRSLSSQFDVRLIPLITTADPAELSEYEARTVMQVTHRTVAALDHQRLHAWRNKFKNEANH